MHVRKTDAELNARFLAKRGIKRFEPQKGRPQSVRLVRQARRAPRVRGK
jgi:hypothetical protein